MNDNGAPPHATPFVVTWKGRGSGAGLTETGRAMTCQEMIEAMAAKRYWTSPGGRTPASTLYASIYQEIKSKGKDSRFRKTERGKFSATGVV